MKRWERTPARRRSPARSSEQLGSLANHPTQKEARPDDDPDHRTGGDQGQGRGRQPAPDTPVNGNDRASSNGGRFLQLSGARLPACAERASPDDPPPQGSTAMESLRGSSPTGPAPTPPSALSASRCCAWARPEPSCAKPPPNAASTPNNKDCAPRPASRPSALTGRASGGAR